MPFESINPPQFPTPIAPYSAGTKAGNTVYVSGTLALGEGGSVLHPGDAAAQTRHVLETIRITLEAAGATLADVAFNHIFLTDWADYPAMNAVYAEYFPGAKPARYCIQCGLVKPGLRRRDRQRGAYRLMPRRRRPLLRRARPGGRAAADPLGRPRRLRRLLGAQSRRRSPADHRVILYDHRGTGRSDRDAAVRRQRRRHGRRRARLMDGLGLERATLIGHAAGGVDRPRARAARARAARPAGRRQRLRRGPIRISCAASRRGWRLLHDSGVARLHPRPADLPLSGALDLRA